MEDDFHQVGADVGNLREDTAADTQHGSTQRFANGEADEARTGQGRGNVGQNDQHDKQFNADENKSNAHAGTQTDVDDVKRFAGK